MKLCKLLIWSSLALTTGYAAPVNAQPTTTAWLRIHVTEADAGFRSVLAACGTPLQYRSEWEESYTHRDRFDPTPPVMTITSSDGQLATWQHMVDQQGSSNPHYWHVYTTVRWSASAAGCPGGFRHSIDSFGVQFLGGLWRPYDIGCTIRGGDGYGDLWSPWDGSHEPPIGEERVWAVRMFAAGLDGFIDGFDVASLRSDNTYAVVTTERTSTGAGTFDIWIGDPMFQGDFDGNGTTNVPDVFAMLAAWFAGDARAGLCDGAGGCAGADINSFLACWFRG
jgi:hypothetical protein